MQRAWAIFRLIVPFVNIAVKFGTFALLLCRKMANALRPRPPDADGGYIFPCTISGLKNIYTMKPFPGFYVLNGVTIRRLVHLSLIVASVFASAGSLSAQNSAKPDAHAPDARKIIDQYVKAAGGSKTLSSIQTLTIEGVFPADGDRKAGAYTFDIKLPNRYYSELNTGEQGAIRAYNGKSAWGQEPSGSATTILGNEALQVEAAAFYYNSHLLNLKKTNTGALFIGHAQVAGRDALQVEVTSPKGLKMEIFFDPQTHLIAKESVTIGGAQEEMIYDDYRSVNGV